VDGPRLNRCAVIRCCLTGLALLTLSAALAQDAPPVAVPPGAAPPPGAVVTPGAPATSGTRTTRTITRGVPTPDGQGPGVSGPAAEPVNLAPMSDAEPMKPTDDIQLSFQNANVDIVVQWLAKTTGKNVVKHPRVQCQLTIVGSKKLKVADALALVYRALALEGFSTIESAKSILIVPEGQEPKTGPEVVGADGAIPDGRQRLIKIFPLKHIAPSELREKIRPVVSERAVIDVSDRANQIMVTDYSDNIRLLGELIKELDVPSGGDTTIEFFPLKHSEAEELANLLTLIVTSQPAPPSAPSSSRPATVTRMTMNSGSPFVSGPSPSMGPDGPGASPMPSPSPTPSPASGAAAAASPVRIWPDKISNRLIVAAQKSKLPEIKRLIDLLDTEKPQDVSVRVLPLKNVNAEDLVRELGPLYLKMSGKSAKDVIEVAASSRANSLIVLSSESNYKAIEKLVASLDTEDAQEKTMQTFLLKNADADEVAKQLQDLNQDQDSGSRYPFIIFSPYGNSGKSGKKSTFVADRRRNSVIVQAPPTAMENIQKLITALDEPISDETLAPKIYRLKFVSATDIEDVLNELFLKKTAQRNYFDPYYGLPRSDSSDASGGAGKLYGKVRITSEPYANAIIVTANSRENLAAVEEVLKELDTPSEAGETTLHVQLRFAKASTMANSINILFARAGAPPLRPVAVQQPQTQQQQNQQQQQSSTAQSNFELEQDAKEEGYFPWLGGQQENQRTPDGRNAVRPVSDLVGRVRVVPDQRSNALLISANVHFFPQILKLIEQLDAPTAQVLIEARIVEVSSDFLDKLGVRWSPDGSRVFTPDDFDNSFLGNVKSGYKSGFGGVTTINTPNNPAANVAQAVTQLRSGVLDASVSMDLLIQFLRKTTDATVLAEPQINIADNELGKLFVGQQVPFIDKSQSTDVGALNQSFQYKDVGVILEVTPHINSTGDVALKIRAESSSIVPGQTLFGGAILDTRNFKTDITAKNGQTLVIGGIIQRQVSDTLRKTPILGDIPGLGWAFKKKDKSTREVELMVFLRPKVVRSPEEAQALLEEVDRKAPLLKKWRNDVPVNKNTDMNSPNK